MTANALRLNFKSPKGGVSVFLNGFMLYDFADIGEMSMQIAPFLRTGSNTVELYPVRPNTSATVSIVDLSRAESPLDAPAVLQSQVDPKRVGLPTISDFILEDIGLEFAWQSAEIIEDILEYSRSIFSVTESLADLLREGPSEQLLSELDIKHSEIARAVGLSREEMDNGLVDGLANLRTQPGFTVECADFQDFLPTFSLEKRIVNLRRKSGGDAIRIHEHGFSVSIARLNDRWQIMR